MRLLTKIDQFFVALSATDQPKWLAQIMRLVTYTAVGRTWVAVAVGLNLISRMGISFISDQREFLFAFYFPLATWFFGNIIKKAVKRKRPFQAAAGVTPLVSSPLDDSMPSLHAAAPFAFGTALFIMHHPAALYVFIWSVFTAYSRLFLRVHYLSDVIAGYALGAVCGSLVYFVADWM